MLRLSALFRTFQEFLQKRQVFREIQSAEKGMENQYMHSSIQGLKEDFNQLTKNETITRDQIEQTFKKRKDAIQQLWDEFILHHQSDSERADRLREGQRNILNRLQELQNRVSDQINTLFDPSRTEIIRARHIDRYRGFLQALHSQGLISTEVPVSPPRIDHLSQGRRNNRSPEASNTPPETAPRTLQDLFRRDTGRRETIRNNPERQQISEKFILFAREWRSEINSYFTIAFANKVLSKSSNLPFLRRAVERPDQLKTLVKSVYDVYLQNNPRQSRDSIRRFFEQNTSVFAQDNIRSALDELVQGLTPPPSSPELERELEGSRDILPADALRQLTQRMEVSLERREVPSRRDLLEMEKVVRFIQRDLLNGEPLVWSDVMAAHAEASTVTPGTQVLNMNPRYHLKKTFELQRIFVGGETIDFSRTILNLGTHSFEFDLPRFVQNLQDIKKAYAWLYPIDQHPVNLTMIIAASDENREGLTERLHLENYRQMMRSLGVNDASMVYYGDFPRALSDLLGQQTRPNEQKTGVQWLQQIRGLQRIPLMEQNPDAYKFLWVVRFLSRTRRIDETKQYNISQFANEILGSREYRAILQMPPSYLSLLPNAAEPGIASEEVVLRGQRADRMAGEYRDYLSRMPEIQRIFDFSRRFKNISTNPPIHLDQDPWPSVVLKLDQAEQVFLSDPEGRITMADNGASRLQPIFHPEMIREYHALKTTNPFFREMVFMGHAFVNTGTVTRFLPLEPFLQTLLTPNSATP